MKAWPFILAAAGLIIIFAAIDLIIKKKKDKNTLINNNDFFLKNSETIIKTAENYRKEHLKWNKCPNSLNTIPYIFAIANIHYEGSDKTLTKFVKFNQLTFTETTICATYIDRDPGGSFHGPKTKTYQITFSKETFNKDWFISVELGEEAVLNLIKSGKTNIDPNCISL